MRDIVLILEKYLILTNNSLVRFLLVGMVNTSVGLAIMLFLLNVAEASYWISTFTGNAVGACVSFLLNRSFTFKSTVAYHKGLTRFFITILLCYFSSYFVSEKVGEWTSRVLIISSETEKNVSVLLGSIFYTISNYLGQKYFVFKIKSRKEFS
ncbi:GtrA family protein [Bacillus sp. SORGH_AS_0510]|uniref:GtrA family protein n=1 Tax=Bacillus sp. SORGH_AS_0510 TaxID=3041771 RepID=UPI0027D867EC|nr:GtrA family protein [Bacillus sp. SORGH_AS_0510]